MSRLSFIYYFKHEHIIIQGIQWKTKWLKYSVIVLEMKSLTLSEIAIQGRMDTTLQTIVDFTLHKKLTIEQQKLH